MANHLHKLASQTAVYGVSAILSKFLNYLLTPYLTRVMELSAYGEMTLLYAVIPFASVVLTMGLATGYFRYAGKCEGVEQKRQLFTTTWSAVSFMSVVFFLILWALQGSVAELIQMAPACVLTMAALIAVDNVAAIPLAALREQRRAVYYTVVNVTGVVVNVVACILFYQYIPGAATNPLWVLVANLIASTVSLAMLVPGIVRWVSGMFSARLLRDIFRYSLPLMMAGLLGVAVDFIDRTLLRFLLPDSVATQELGVYGAAAKIAALMVIFRQIYTLGAEPFFLQGFSKEDFKSTNALATKYFTIAGIGIFLLITLFSDQFALIVGAEYRVGMDIVSMLLFANLLAGILVNLSFWYKAVDRTRLAVWINGLGILAVLAINWALIPMMGNQGAALARVVAMVLMVGVSYGLCQRYFPVPFELRRIGFYFLLGGAIFGMSYGTSLLPEWGQITANFLLLLGYGLVALRLEWRGRWNGLWKK